MQTADFQAQYLRFCTRCSPFVRITCLQLKTCIECKNAMAFQKAAAWRRFFWPITWCSACLLCGCSLVPFFGQSAFEASSQAFADISAVRDTGGAILWVSATPLLRKVGLHAGNGSARISKVCAEGRSTSLSLQKERQQSWGNDLDKAKRPISDENDQSTVWSFAKRKKCDRQWMQWGPMRYSHATMRLQYSLHWLMTPIDVIA